MKRKKFLSMLPAAVFAAGNLAANPDVKGDKKMLIVYYSWSGNTRRMAKFIEKSTGAKVVEIVPETAYPDDYSQTVKMAKKEVDAHFLRPIKTKIPDLADFDTVFVGSPNWWGTISSPVRTFLASNDFSGKRLIPFMTHEGSRMGVAVSDIKTICPKSRVLEALPVRGGSVSRAEQTVEKWLRTLAVI